MKRSFFSIVSCSALILLGASSCMQAKKIKRQTKHNVHELIKERRSLYNMSGEAVTEKELMTMFEAATLAPSSSNNQPWRFIYVTPESKNWQKMFDLMVEFNQGWAKNAGALVLIISRNNPLQDGQFSRTHSFDTGAAWQNFALQGTALNLIVHGMAGFDYDQAKKAFTISDDYTIEAMAAVGRPAQGEQLRGVMAERDAQPSKRNPLESVVFKDQLPH